jgi:hypothetical protein
VPVGAVGSQAGQDHVWVIDRGVLARRAVTTGRRDEHRVEVLAGLDEQATVLALRFDELREGRAALVVAARVPGPAALAGSAATTAR